MKVLFDVTCLIPEKLSGIGVYTKFLFKSLSDLNVELIPVYKSSRFFKKKWIEHHIGQQASAFLPGLPALKGAKILHGPDFRLLSSSANLKKVVTIHDVAVFHEGFNSVSFRESGQKQLNHLLDQQKPDGIIVPTHTISKEIENLRPNFKNSTHVIHHGADHLIRQESKDHPPLSKADRPFFLYVGHIENRKNLGGIIQGFELFCQTNQDVDLFIVGKNGFNAEFYIEMINQSPVKNRIKTHGYLEVSQLASLYRQAQAFVFPSFYEGFGFPILEAMSMNCPVITSDHGSMLEVAGSAATLVDPYSQNSICKALLELTDSRHCLKLKELGQKRVQSFRWKKTAQKVIEVYQGSF